MKSLLTLRGHLEIEKMWTDCTFISWLKSSGPSWCKQELSSSCKGYTIPGLIYSSLPIKTSLYTDNQVVLNTCKIWFQFRQQFRAASSLGPLNYNHLFPHHSFSVCYEKGVRQFKYLYVDGVVDSFLWPPRYPSVSLFPNSRVCCQLFY